MKGNTFYFRGGRYRQVSVYFMTSSSMKSLMHWDMDKKTDILQIAFSNDSFKRILMDNIENSKSQ